MTTHPVRKLSDSTDEPGEAYFLPSEKLIAGNPKQTVWMRYTDRSGTFFAGLWRSEPGQWRVSYTEEEVCHLLEGKSILRDEAGQAVTVVAGESFVIPRGFVGTWEVVETTTKRFVIYEPGTEA